MFSGNGGHCRMFEWDEVAGSAHVDPTAAVVADIRTPAEAAARDDAQWHVERGVAPKANGCVVAAAVILVVHADAVTAHTS